MSATLKRIAELTGVSIRSVNRALQGAAGLSEAKRKRILDTASALGYTPNIAARNLRLQRNNFIGIVVPDTGLKSESFLSVTSRKINELQLRLERAGYFTLFGVNTGKPGDLRQLLGQWTGLVSTVIFFSWNRNWKGRDIAGRLPLQYIFVDLESDFGHHMVIDRAPGIYDGIRFLLDRGCSRLARCGNVSSRDAGFNAALQDLSGRSIAHRHFPAPCSFEDGFRIGDELTAGHFDAVFFDTDRMAFGFLKYCWQNGIRIPDEIAVIGFDDEQWDICSCPSLSTVAHPIGEMNDAILELVQNPRKEPCREVFKTRFIRRESV
ncbi:MAG: LacI family DNA-binding transcriptional regulator [Lentisphaeria bacterium]|nr:LacI family DNA-binding transcriptional regulator [Lentisphaeria bacterium]